MPKKKRPTEEYLAHSQDVLDKAVAFIAASRAMVALGVDTDDR